MDGMDPHKMSDHDLLVSMHVTLGRAIEDIKTLNNKVTDFNNNYAKKEDVEKEITEMKSDVKWLQRIAYGGMGILAAVQFLLNYIKN